MVYAWCLDRMAHATPEQFETWHEQLFAPPDGIDPDKVTQQVVEEEMSLFHQLTRQTGVGGS
jgi:hypothetical protein